MRRLLLVLSLFACATLPLGAEAQLSFNEQDQRRQVCQSYGVDLRKMNDCYYDMALAMNDVSICDEIRWGARAAACRRKILFQEKFDVFGVIPQLPLAAFAIAVGLLIWKRPPRVPYLQGAIIGTVLAGFIIFVQRSDLELAQVIMPYSGYFTIPVDGLMNFSPDAFKLLPAAVQLVVVHALFYGSVLGLLLQGDKKSRQLALPIVIVALIATYWYHPWLSFIHKGIEVITS